MANQETPLLRQLSVNSEPYRDPLALLDWSAAALDRYWLPPEAMSLFGLAEFESLSEAARIRLSQFEMLGHVEAGLALERAFLELTASRLKHTEQGAEYAYLLHEMREGAGHSLMYMRLARTSGFTMPRAQVRLPRLARPGSRLLAGGALYWAMLVIGQDVPDKLHRFVRRYTGTNFSPLIRQMIGLHMVDEARHIAYARQRLDLAMSQRGAFSAYFQAAVLDRLFNRFVRAYFWPGAELYQSAGLGDGRVWRKLALRNPQRREFVLRLVAPTMRLLASHGISVRLR